eukprot:Filipodium_phascolosomae@DN2426_c0_g1_i2.p1
MGQKKRDFAEFKNQGKCRKKGTDMKHLENEVACFGATDEIRCQIGEELSKRYAFQPSNYIPEALVAYQRKGNKDRLRVYWQHFPLSSSTWETVQNFENFENDCKTYMMLKDKWEELMNNSKETPPKDSPLQE